MIFLHKKSLNGVTLIELMITVLAVTILVFGISGILAAGHTNYNIMQKRITRGVVPESYEVKSTFDRIVRKSVHKYDISEDKNELTVYYYSQDIVKDLSKAPDRYATFYLSDDKLMLEQGTVENFFSSNPILTITRTIKLTATYDDEQDVKVVPSDEGMFSIDGSGIKMAFVLDNETDSKRRKIETLKMTVTSTAVRHNP